MKTIGVLGGIGPQATMDFEARVHAASQRILLGQANEAYPPLLVYYLRHPPIVADEQGKPLPPLRLDPRLPDAARRLGEWADFLVLTSNGMHHFQPEIEAAAGRPLLSMISVTLDEVVRRGWRTVGALGFGKPTVYTEALAARSITCVTVPDAVRERVDAVVLPFMAGRGGPEAAAPVREAVEWLRAQGVDGSILGCTELPLLLGDEADAPDLLNPTALLAEAAVRVALD
jgi:aspartate racemase